MFTLPAIALPAASIAHNVTTAAKLRFMSDPPRLAYRPGNYAGEKADREGHATVALSCETAIVRRLPPIPRLRPCRQHPAGTPGPRRRPILPFTHLPLACDQASGKGATDWLQMRNKTRLPTTRLFAGAKRSFAGRAATGQETEKIRI